MTSMCCLGVMIVLTVLLPAVHSAILTARPHTVKIGDRLELRCSGGGLRTPAIFFKNGYVFATIHIYWGIKCTIYRKNEQLDRYSCNIYFRTRTLIINNIIESDINTTWTCRFKGYTYLSNLSNKFVIKKEDGPDKSQGDKSIGDEPDDEGLPLPIIIGSVIGAITVTGIIVIVFIVVFKKRQSKNSSKEDVNSGYANGIYTNHKPKDIEITANVIATNC